MVKTLTRIKPVPLVKAVQMRRGGGRGAVDTPHLSPIMHCFTGCLVDAVFLSTVGRALDKN